MGTYIIVHDDARMERGEPCTVLYHVGAPAHPLEQDVAFHCIPRRGSLVHSFTTTVERTSLRGMETLIDYQFPEDTEIHGVPSIALVSNETSGGSPPAMSATAYALDDAEGDVSCGNRVEHAPNAGAARGVVVPTADFAVLALEHHSGHLRLIRVGGAPTIFGARHVLLAGALE